MLNARARLLQDSINEAQVELTKRERSVKTDLSRYANLYSTFGQRTAEQYRQIREDGDAELTQLLGDFIKSSLAEPEPPIIPAPTQSLDNPL